MRNSFRRARITGLIVASCWAQNGLVAQQTDSTPPLRDSVPVYTPRTLPSQRPAPAQIRWYHIGAGLGLIALSSAVDESLRDKLQAHRSSGKDDVATAFRHVGQPEVYGVVGLGTIAVGLISGNDRVRLAGERISAGLLTAAAAVSVLKEAVGRQRPISTTNAFRFKPFSGRDSWPSGHATMAFALAAGVADEVHNPVATVGLYSAASLTAWSRLNDNKHWLSDVLAGAAVGITSARLMSGRWKVLGIGAPRFLFAPGEVGVSLGL